MIKRIIRFMFRNSRELERRSKIRSLDVSVRALTTKIRAMERIAEDTDEVPVSFRIEIANAKIQVAACRAEMVHLLEWDD